MSHLVEGIGDEIVWIIAAVIIISIIYFAWKSTGISPTEYYVWLVRMRVNPNSNTFQILHMADADAHVFEQRLATGRNRLNGAVALGSEQSTALDEQLQSNYDGSNNLTLRQRNVSRHEASEPGSSNSDVRGIEQLLQNATGGNVNEFEGLRNSDENFLEQRVQSQPVTDAQLASSAASSVDNITLNVMDKPVPALSGDSVIEEDRERSSEIKLKFLDDTQVVATTSLEATVGEFKRKYFYDPIVAGKVVRLIYRGQLLRDDSRSLSSYGIQDKCVLHCHVSSAPYAQASSTGVHSNVSQTQTYRGRSIEDNPADPYVLRLRNAVIRWFRISYNSVVSMIMGPSRNDNRDEVAAAAAAASRGLSNRTEAVSLGMIFGHHLHIFFAVKFVLLWTFVYVYPQYTNRLSMIILSFLTGFFATIMFTVRHDNNQRAEQPAT